MRRSCMVMILIWMFLPTLLGGRAAAEELHKPDQIPQIRIDAVELGSKTACVSYTQEHSWFIRCFFSKMQESSVRCTVIQTLSPGLTYSAGSVEVTLIRENGESIAFDMEQMYTLTAGTVFVEGGTADRISIALTEAGCEKLSDGGELRISYRAKINHAAQMGTQLLGTAQLSFTDSEGNRTVSLSDKASVSSGGFHIRLTDPAGFPLSGGEFMVARKASSEELKDHTLTIELLDTGEETIAVQYVPFCPAEDLTVEPEYTAKTDKKGEAVCFGLPYGEYYLVQTLQPEAAYLPAAPVKVIVNEVSHLTAQDGWKDSSGMPADHTVCLVNGSIRMPKTGGPGVYAYTVSGILVILSACMLLWSNRRRKVLY